MSKWKRFRPRTNVDLRGRASESHLCVDCGFNTAPGMLNRAETEQVFARRSQYTAHANSQTEMYMVHDHVWRAAGMEPYGGCLCIGCLEKRLGRRLMPHDFSSIHPFNRMPGTRRLLERQGRYDPLGDYPG